MKKYVAEFLGTFAMVFCGTGAIVINEVMPGSVSHAGIAITFGLIVMTMIYAVGNISGAHMNPAVTIAFALNRTFKARDVFPYICSQVAAAVVASFILKWLFPASLFLGATLPSGSAIQSFIFEVILTFILMFVILQVATGAKEQGMFAGMAIGAVVLLEAMFAGPVSGASMNPARSLGPAIAANAYQHLWVYVSAPVIGAALAVIIFRYFKS